MPLTSEFVERLPSRSLRVTGPRLGAISTQAVYDNLHALAGAGLVRRIEPT